MEQEIYNKILKILKHELVPALGCTEPIAIAYAAAVGREALGTEPDRMKVQCSANIIKNAKSVVVPMTKNMRGIEAAALVGMIGGDAGKKLEVLTTINDQHLNRVRQLLEKGICIAELLDTEEKLHLKMFMWAGDEVCMVELLRTHTGIKRIEKNKQVIFEQQIDEKQHQDLDYSSLNIENILAFANHAPLEEVEPVIGRQIEYNTKIAAEGLKNDYGVNIGATILETYGTDAKVKAKAMPAAGSDARMNGCELPVVINSGSGNQGMTVSLPVIEFAKMLEVDREKLIRALCVSNLVSIYQKSAMGRLSAYCGAVTAASGAGAGITYLYGGGKMEIGQTIINTLGNVSGIVCDGAKSSCAAKIASSVDAAILATSMTLGGKVFQSGDGIVKDSIQKTVDGVVELAKEGMRETDEVILRIMID